MDQEIYIRYYLDQAKKTSMVNLSDDYRLKSFELMEDRDQYKIQFKLEYPGQSIKAMAAQFKKIRRASNGPGWGKNPIGWEFYKENTLDEQYRFIIDTLSNSLDFSYVLSY